jgi:hypothetical protein
MNQDCPGRILPILAHDGEIQVLVIELFSVLSILFLVNYLTRRDSMTFSCQSPISAGASISVKIPSGGTVTGSFKYISRIGPVISI